MPDYKVHVIPKGLDAHDSKRSWRRYHAAIEPYHAALELKQGDIITIEGETRVPPDPPGSIKVRVITVEDDSITVEPISQSY